VSDSHITTLIEAACKMRQLIKDMETQDIRGFVIYKPDTSKADDTPEGDRALMNESELEMLRKFEGKIV